MLASISVVRGSDQSIKSSTHAYETRRRKLIITDTPSATNESSATVASSADVDKYDFGRHGIESNHQVISGLRGSRFLVFDTSSDANAALSIRDDLDDNSSLFEVDTNARDYDFGRLLERKRKNTAQDRSSNKNEKDKQQQSLRKTSKKEARQKSNLDVDVEYLESFLLSKQKKREKHKEYRKLQGDLNKHTEQVNDSQDAAHEALTRFLESSKDQSYVYTSIPTPSPMANTEEPTEAFDVPTLCE